jgi:hypothetical protein
MASQPDFDLFDYVVNSPLDEPTLEQRQEVRCVRTCPRMLAI